ncbi:MAG: S41 family peptidase [Cyanobacteria bacterium]|nr:S41 family peptidase [Cyanobacteriota bacterium]
MFGLLLPADLGPALDSAQPALALSDVQQLVVEAWRLVNQSYVDPARLDAVQWRRLRQKALEQPIQSSDQAYAAIETMLEPIGDPYTRLLRPADFGSLQSNTRGTVCGVGLQLGLRPSDQAIVVIAPLDGSPAAEAGIASGSELVSVNGRSTKELGLEATAAALRGDAGSEVIVTLIAPDKEQAREAVLKRRQVDLQPVRASQLTRAGHQLGVLRITQFSEPVPQQVHDALEAFSQAGPGQQPIEGLLLDLRNNSGGLVQAGLAVANSLLDAEPIVETQDRGGISDRQVARAGSLYAGPMLTLVNGGTASASEILAGALQDSGRSPLAGSRTYGKGLIQTLIPLGNGSGLAVTVARYLTPSGRDIQNLGIEPDLGLTEPEPLNPGGDDDDWLEQAETLLIAAIETARQP